MHLSCYHVLRRERLARLKSSLNIRMVKRYTNRAGENKVALLLTWLLIVTNTGCSSLVAQLLWGLALAYKGFSLGPL